MSSGKVLDDSGSDLSRSGASRQKEEQGESGATCRAATRSGERERRNKHAAVREARVDEFLAMIKGYGNRNKKEPEMSKDLSESVLYVVRE